MDEIERITGEHIKLSKGLGHLVGLAETLPEKEQIIKDPLHHVSAIALRDLLDGVVKSSSAYQPNGFREVLLSFLRVTFLSNLLV